MIKALDLWLPAYLRGAHRSSAPPTDILFCICDHFEPLHYTDHSGALRRLQSWETRYGELRSYGRDAEGNPPRHTFFYPIEQYSPDLLNPLESLCRRHGCEVEIHLHHHNDTEASLREQLRGGVQHLRNHGFLSSAPSGKPTFAFIHGNWALDNSHPKGDHCGVSNELAILKEEGCFADLTMPSAPDRSQTQTINSIYYAKSTGVAKSHNRGTPMQAAAEGADSTAPLRECSDTLLLVQGPLGLNWHRRKWKFLPRIENADLTGHNPPSQDRLALWMAFAPFVRNRPEWRFIKLHTHGAVEANSEMLLGRPMQNFHQLMTKVLQKKGIRLHYVSARELVNIAHVAEAGKQGNAGDWREFLFSPPAIKRP